MSDYRVPCRPFEKIRANHLLRGGRNDRVDICSVAHKLASNFRRLERSNTTRHEECDLPSSQFSTLGGDNVFGRMAHVSMCPLPRLHPFLGCWSPSVLPWSWHSISSQLDCRS